MLQHGGVTADGVHASLRLTSNFNVIDKQINHSYTQFIAGANALNLLHFYHCKLNKILLAFMKVG